MKKLRVETIEKALGGENTYVQTAAMNACVGRSDIPPSVIETGLRDREWMVRKAATKACRGRSDIPIATIEIGLRDRDSDVREAAMLAIKANGMEAPLIRTIEPPEKVYKKCLNNVIVVAEIPKDAQVRGSINGKCRADKAKIVDIIGDFYGEKVGISTYDMTTTYWIGDEVKVDNFDYSDAECSTGFHFFCSLELAENY